MTRSLRDRYNTVAATLALALAVGTTGAYAADKITAKDIAKNAVTAPAVKDGSLTGSELKDGSVAGKDVKDGSVTGSDLKAGTLPAGPLGYVSGQSPPLNPTTCCGVSNQITLTRPTRVMATAVLDDLGLTCVDTCAVDFGLYAAEQAEGSTATFAFRGSGGALVDLTPTGPTVEDRVVMGVVDLAPGTYTIGLGWSPDGDVTSFEPASANVATVVLGNPANSSYDGVFVRP